MCVCVYIYGCVSVCVYTYVYMYIYVYICIYVCIYVYICICVYMYIYTHTHIYGAREVCFWQMFENHHKIIFQIFFFSVEGDYSLISETCEKMLCFSRHKSTSQ